MRTFLKSSVFLVIGVLWVGFASSLRATLIYDNSFNDVLYRFDPGIMEVGDEIVLTSSPERYLTNFAFEFWSTNAVTGLVLSGQVEARVRFYKNDGPAFNGYPSPWSKFYDSSWFPIIATERQTLVFAGEDFCAGLFMPVESNMTWSVQFRGMGPGDHAGVDIYTPATTGKNYPDYWQNIGSEIAPNWVLLTNNPVVPMDFAARMEASTQLTGVNLEPPKLTCVRSGPNMLVSWPCDRIGWRLQVQTNAPAAGIISTWYTITNSELVNTWLFPVAGNGSVFCRLKAP